MQDTKAMIISEDSSGIAVVVQLAGRLDAVTSPVLDEKLATSFSSGRPLVLDFSEVEYISSLGLRVLLKAQKQAKSMAQLLLIAGLKTAARDVFDVSGFTRLFAIYSSLAEALDSLR